MLNLLRPLLERMGRSHRLSRLLGRFFGRLVSAACVGLRPDQHLSTILPSRLESGVSIFEGSVNPLPGVNQKPIRASLIVNAFPRPVEDSTFQYWTVV